MAGFLPVQARTGNERVTRDRVCIGRGATQIADGVRGMKLCKDKMGGVFDLPNNLKDQFMAVRGVDRA